MRQPGNPLWRNPPLRAPDGPFIHLLRSFLTGLAMMLPITLTAWLFWSPAGWIDSGVMPVSPALGTDLHGVVIFLLFTVIPGVCPRAASAAACRVPGKTCWTGCRSCDASIAG